MSKVTVEWVECESCKGRGTVGWANTRCAECGGRGGWWEDKTPEGDNDKGKRK